MSHDMLLAGWILFGGFGAASVAFVLHAHIATARAIRHVEAIKALAHPAREPAPVDEHF